MDGFWIGQQASIAAFLGLLIAIALSNLRQLERLSDAPAPGRWPRLSVLVPARNESATIEACLHSLLEQDYPDFEVLVLNDASEDDTLARIERLAAKRPNLTALSGQPIPDGWLGKHWACHQLAQTADGEILLFTDADTRFKPGALRSAVAALIAADADLAAVLPYQITRTWPERLSVPIIPWSILTFLPLRLAYRLRLPELSAAIGQCLVFRRPVYVEVGGHAAVRSHAADDLALARRIKAAGFRWRLFDGQDQVSCRMYRSPGEIWTGLTKNLYPAFDYRPFAFVFVWVWLGVVFLAPLALLAWALLGGRVPSLAAAFALLAVVEAIVLWRLTARRFQFSRGLPLLYPAVILAAISMAFGSLGLTWAGKTSWKGRALKASPSRLALDEGKER